MIAILGGLTAAMCWAAANLTSSRASRLIGASSVVGWMMLVGVIVAVPLTLASGPLPPMTPSLAVWLTTSGLGSVFGLLLVYRGLRLGKVGVVSAIVSTEGAIAAVISIVTGETLNLLVIATLFVIVAGLAIVGLATSDVPEAGATSTLGIHHDERRAAIFGVMAAGCFGLSIYATGRAGEVFPPFAAVLPARLAGVVIVLIPMAVTGRLQLSRAAVPMVVLIGLAEVFGNAAFVVGARESIAISAVLASQFAAVAAIAAFLIFRERLSVGQRSGIVAIALGVAALTLVKG